MPASKMRGFTGYLQVLLLKSLYKTEAGRKLYFTGGTYLRLAHDTERFSEDLDFNTGFSGKSKFRNSCASGGGGA